MKPSPRNFVVLGLSLFALAGCQSGTFTHYTSPQISGRVLAADTHEPLAGADVARIILNCCVELNAVTRAVLLARPEQSHAMHCWRDSEFADSETTFGDFVAIAQPRPL